MAHTWHSTKYLKVADIPAPDGEWLYEINLPDFLASWDVYAVWEMERTLSMAKNLKKGDVLYEIGGEKFWQAGVYAQFVGGENMVLIEPTKAYWPSAKQIWEHNNLKMPRACWTGLIGAENTEGGNEELTVGEWPKATEGELFDGLSYTYIHEHSNSVAQMTIDAMVEKTGVVPSALTMDCEGPEAFILYGSTKTLKTHRPLVWVSEHPDLSFKNYNYDSADIEKFMTKMGYKRHYLVRDHEDHVFYYPEERTNVILG